MSQYAVSDIHGQYRLYREMLDDIRFSDDDTLFIIGDMVDRGPQSLEIIKDVMVRPNVVPLIGNHEMMIRDHYHDRGSGRDCWLLSCNGGLVTKAAFEELSGNERQAILDWINTLYLQKEIVIGDMTFLMSHSACLTDRGDVRWQAVDDRLVFNTVWESPWRTWEYFAADRFAVDGRWHVIGHVPVQRLPGWIEDVAERCLVPYIDDENHVVNIDLGCASLESPSPYPYASLCCMDLTAFAEGRREDAFRFYRD